MLYRFVKWMIVPALVALAALGLLAFLGCRLLIALMAPGEGDGAAPEAPASPLPDRRRAGVLLR